MSAPSSKSPPGGDELILVDPRDRVVGHLDKERCHDGEGVLHRAFSIFLFDEDGRLLIQRRSPQKRLWGSSWSNSCCSHPRRGEEMEAAAHRRLGEELGIDADLRFLYRFQYQASDGDRGSENELCSVFLGTVDRQRKERLRPNPEEIAEHRWVPRDTVDRMLRDPDEPTTPWFELEWRRISEEFLDVSA